MIITVTLRADDAEPILREAAEEAAKYGAWCDYIGPRTYNPPSGYGIKSLTERKKEWLAKFLRAKRIIWSFDVDYEPTSEEETLTVHFQMKNEKRKLRNIAGMKFYEVSGGEPDYKNPFPEYRREVHAEACRQAAKRVVRAWRQSLERAREAA